ncbi:hypothetical protein LFZ31_21035 [Salmonella enterica subsp. enterica serovar Newport str. S09097]|nr:hypothetical protein LFZ31_21035 [Salmonella enterica subsp. enterica serovar Newport str. S09097]
MGAIWILPRCASSISVRALPVAWLESNETSCILYTSGTTGKPKGVQARRRRLCGGAGNLERYFCTS